MPFEIGELNEWYENIERVGPNASLDTLNVVDAAGSTTTQEFQILVRPEAGNYAPL